MINHMAVRGTLGALGQNYFLRLGAAWLRSSGVEPGATVTVKLAVASPQEGNRNRLSWFVTTENLSAQARHTFRS